MRAIELLASHLHLNLLILQLAQLLVRGGNVVEGLEDLRLELGLHGGERDSILVLILVVELAVNAAFAAILGTDGGLSGGRRGRRHVDDRDHGRWRRLGLRPFVGRPQVDDLAQQDLGVHQLIAPNDDRLEGQRTLAQARHHRLAAGLDALGDGDLALTREQLDRAHVAQVHAHGIVRALRRLGTRLHDRGNGRGDRYRTAAGIAIIGPVLAVRSGRPLLVVLALNHGNAHVGQHRHGVLDLIGGHFLGGEHGIDGRQG